MKIVVLSSGGVDSSVMMLLLKREGYNVLPLHINYGQLAREREWAACRKVCTYLGVSEPVPIDVSGFGKIPSGLTDPARDIVKDAFLPNRNLLFITIGSAYAFSRSLTAVAIGLLSNPIFPDQTQSFVTSAQRCVSAALGVEMRVLAPLITLDKRDTLQIARKYRLPLELTYHCHSGKDKPCGICISCRERLTAEEALSTGLPA